MMCPLCVDFGSVMQTCGVCAHKRRQLLGGNVATVEHVRRAAALRDHAVQAVAAISAAYVVVTDIGYCFAVNGAIGFSRCTPHAVDGVGFGFEK